jgi:DNA mismatch repair protein MutS
MTNLQMYHLHLDYDEKNNTIKYDRILKSGSGLSEYGFLLAKHMINDSEFSILANEINEEINGDYVKASRYNSKVVVEECQICHYRPTESIHKPLETHHIHFQRDTDEDGFILAKPHVHKNHKSNLCVLCSKCHDKIDTNELIIYGYEETIDGSVLKYEIVDKKVDVVTNTLDEDVKELVLKKMTQKQILEKLVGRSTQVHIKSLIKQYKSN